MAKLTFKKLGQIVAIAVLCLSLWGCGLVNPRPPRAVVEAAIAQKLSQTQAVLYRQFESSVDPADLAQVGSIRISDHHWTTLANQPAVEVAGTYHLKGGQLTAAQRRQTRDFDLYLQRGESKEQWLLLEPVLARSGEVLQWQPTPLIKPEAVSPASPA
ncbi:hypothetical protein IQ273_26485 [Nodosilinea sp. LEGE 07298]|uniref:hypothetical protein n=1 Tax=Nodosilinea sp. LEGE 07298 TaxID=2777970 RepID=UPI001881A74E|nr:hypothetical protein [Nodosilinea sp. LEGE 07298]MBE9112940.1 hypothetical protein [Nodosilinea sp. LEGE 07298]